MLRVAINGLMFNVSWLAIVGTHNNWLAPLIVALHLCLHFLIWHGGKREALLVAGVSLFGIAFDQLLFAGGLMQQSSGATTAPLWLSCLWPVFATTLPHLFSGLLGNLLLAMPIGAIGGAASYLAGTRLANVEFGAMPASLILLALLWALLLPVLLRVAACARPLHPAG